MDQIMVFCSNSMEKFCGMPQNKNSKNPEISAV